MTAATALALWVVGLSLALLLYTSVGYPLLHRPRPTADQVASDWPMVSLSIREVVRAG